MATIVVTQNNKTEPMDLNGGLTAGKALAHFYRCDEREVSGKVGDNTVQLNQNTLSVPGDLSTALRDRDVITIYSAQVARGGVKGA